MNDEPVILTASSPFGVAARVTIEKLYKQMMNNLAGTISGEDIEALHDMRVASRRLRAALRIFKKCFSKKILKSVEDGVRNVTRALGQVRDFDVFIDYLNSDAASKVDVSWVINEEKNQREEARKQMLESLHELESGELSNLISELLSTARKVSPQKKNQFYLQAADMISLRLDDIQTRSKALKDPTDIDGLHAMRISAKRLRYTMEGFLPCFGKPLQTMVSQIKELQEYLGQLHDCDVWIDKLRVYRERPGISQEQITAVEYLISERSEYRHKMYLASVEHWNKLTRSRFAKKLIKLVTDEPQVK